MPSDAPNQLCLVPAGEARSAELEVEASAGTLEHRRKEGRGLALRLVDGKRERNARSGAHHDRVHRTLRYRTGVGDRASTCFARTSWHPALCTLGHDVGLIGVAIGEHCEPQRSTAQGGQPELARFESRFRHGIRSSDRFEPARSIGERGAEGRAHELGGRRACAE